MERERVRWRKETRSGGGRYRYRKREHIVGGRICSIFDKLVSFLSTWDGYPSSASTDWGGGGGRGS